MTYGFDVHFAHCFIPKHYDNQLEPLIKNQALIDHLNQRLIHEKPDCRLDDAYAIINLNEFDHDTSQKFVVSFIESHAGYEAKKIISFIEDNNKIRYDFFTEKYKTLMVDLIKRKKLTLYRSKTTSSQMIYPANILDDFEVEIAKQKLHLLQFGTYNEIDTLDNIEHINYFSIATDFSGNKQVFFIQNKILPYGLQCIDNEWEIIEFDENTLDKIQPAIRKNILSMYSLNI